MFKNKPILNFNEYVYSLTDEERLKLMEFCSNFGNASQVLTSLVDTPPCCANKEIEVRINDEFMLIYQKVSFKKYPIIMLYKINEIRYCFHSKDSYYDVVGFIKTDGTVLTQLVDASESEAFYYRLSYYVGGFEKIPYEPISEENRLQHLANVRYLDGNTLCTRHTKGDRVKSWVEIENIQNVIWCEQIHGSDGDSDDSYCLVLHHCSRYDSETLIFDSHEEAFFAAMKLKKRIPHLLYGPSKEFEEIYRRNPAELMALAKSRMMNK